MKRRQLLTLSALTGISQIPSIWSKPVIDSIVIPSHARTTCALTLDVPDVISDCTVHSDVFNYYIEDRNGCPELIASSNIPQGTPVELLTLQSIGETSLLQDGVFSRIETQSSVFGINCDTGTLLGNSVPAGMIPTFSIFSTSGGRYGLQGTYSILPQGAGVSATNLSLSLLA